MEKHYFLAKLIPPRPSFTADMNAEERQVMMDHGAYLRKYVEAGTVIVMGPVQPTGPWGLAVFGANSEDEVRTITARDPTVLSGLVSGGRFTRCRKRLSGTSPAATPGPAPSGIHRRRNLRKGSGSKIDLRKMPGLANEAV